MLTCTDCKTALPLAQRFNDQAEPGGHVYFDVLCPACNGFHHFGVHHTVLAEYPVKAPTVTKTAHGRYTHGRPYNRSGTWHRRDQYQSDDGHRGTDNAFCAGPTDDSPMHCGPYDPKCSCCWLGFAHTTAAHDQRR
jgi:hypothetical protein